MGISRDSRHKRRKSGGKRHPHQKKRKYDMGRPPALTKLGSKRIHLVRCRGGHIKHRGLRLDTGNFAWATEACTRKTRILGVVYNASNNELVRTNTLVKNAIIQIDATPFRQWYEQHYGTEIGKKKKLSKEAEAKEKAAKEAKKQSSHVLRKIAKRRNKHGALDTNLADQFNTGRLYACISSRPGQSGRCDGYVLEGDELAFYLKKLSKK